MKSLEDLKKLRDQARKKIDMRDSDKDYRVVVGMATCGIAAGARITMNALIQEMANGDYSCTVSQTGCIGMCTLEPIVEVTDAKGNKTTYVHVDATRAKEILESHIKHGQVLAEYTANASVL